jgi:hypothetical protein
MRDPEDQPGGFETRAELRRDIPPASTLPPHPPMEPAPHPAARRIVLRRWAIALIAAVVVGIILYFVVASL